MASSRYKLDKSEEPACAGREDAGSANKVDVSEILKENFEKQREGENPLSVEKRKSRKKRDYLLGMIFVNLAIVSPLFLFSLNVVTLLFCLSGVVIFSSGFTWVMWQVIGDY